MIASRSTVLQNCDRACRVLVRYAVCHFAKRHKGLALSATAVGYLGLLVRGRRRGRDGDAGRHHAAAARQRRARRARARRGPRARARGTRLLRIFIIIIKIST